jgi:uncharacterized protein (DUF302 family)
MLENWRIIMNVTRRMRAIVAAGTVLTLMSLAGHVVGAGTPENGVVKVRSAYSVPETIARIKQDVAVKKIMFFFEIDQSKLAADAGIKLNPSTLLTFGNPALGSQFMTSNPDAGIDWPVRVLVTQDSSGQVWVLYNDFSYIARRHHIADREKAFAMASDVISSVTSTVTK